jgi:hypothetical protein
MNKVKVKLVTDNDEQKLIEEFHFLEEVLDFSELLSQQRCSRSGSSCSLDIFEMDLWILAQVDLEVLVNVDDDEDDETGGLLMCKNEAAVGALNGVT